MFQATQSFTLSTIVLACVACAAHADTFPQSPGEMKHALIAFDGTNIELSIADIGPTPPLEMRNFGEHYTAPADVLDGKWYNDQYGFLANGTFSPPTGAAFYIELTSPVAGLEAYAGGMRPMRPQHTYAPIFGTDGSPMFTQWNGMMTHHWFATATPGPYEATFRVYIGDAQTGAPLSGFGSDTMTFSWIPAPSSTAVLGLAGIAATRRRRS